MATTYPTFDPSWYAPISLLLSTAEIDLASVCASAPVFWPMLCRNVEKIFVTYELKITVEDRVVDAFELHHTRPRTGGGGCDDDDDDEGKGLEPPGSHYRNSFIRDQVNPFGKDGWLDSPAGAKNGTGMARVIVRSESQDPNEARKKTDKLPRFLSRDPPPA